MSTDMNGKPALAAAAGQGIRRDAICPGSVESLGWRCTSAPTPPAPYGGMSRRAPFAGARTGLHDETGEDT